MKVHGRRWLTRVAAASAFAALLSGCSNPPPAGIVRIDIAAPVDAEGREFPPTQLPHQRSITPTLAPIAAYLFTLPPAQGRDQERGLGVFVPSSAVPIQAFVNNVPIFQNGDVSSSRILASSWRASASFRVAPYLLQPYRNELLIHVFDRPGSSGMLGPIYVGDPTVLENWVRNDGLLRHIAPLLIGAVLIGVGIIALSMWSGRSDSKLFLLLAAGAILWGLQNFYVQLPSPLFPRPIDQNVVFISLYVWFPMLLVVFFMRFVYINWRPYELAAATLAALAAPALYVAGHFGKWGLVSKPLRAAVLIFSMVALAAVLRYAWRERATKGALLLFAGLCCVVFATRDWFVSLSSEYSRVIFMTNYSGVGLVVLSGWMLIDRYHKAYATSEAINLDLERRVKVANAELAQKLVQVQAARIEAEGASLAKSHFFAAASHDLRQPLHSLGFFAAALNQHATSHEARDLVARIGDSIVALESLFNELLDLSKLDAGAISVQRRNVSLQVLFDRLSGEFHAQAVEQELRMRFVPTKLLAYTDPILLERILLNLVSNALRYTARGGVAIGARRRGDQVCVEVWDTGIGIPADRHSQIFDEFYQVGNPGRDRRRGLGLGLAIVRRLTALLGHQLTLISAPGQGTRFGLWLPRAVGAAESVRSAAELHLPDTFAGKRVLLVDDDADIRIATATLLGQWGLAVRTAGSIPEVDAVLAAGFVPELAIVDLRLEALDDGLDLIELLRRRLRATLPAFLLSGDTGAAEIARVRASGVSLLTKPVSPARLRSVLHASFTADTGAAS